MAETSGARLLSIKELRKITGYSAAYFYCGRSTGRLNDLKFVKIGKRVFVREVDLTDWIDRHVEA
ncbi:MAG: DNA-binding protein [Geobacter sp.]|nr:MAG: DNA-binding protein [Geobacter sp.]